MKIQSVRILYFRNLKAQCGNSAKYQSGNALFLILIAVALFAALSYAITQSGRGGGNISKEQATISASQITQYASEIRSALTRMVITGTVISNLSFEPTPNNAPCDVHPDYCVFSPSGGGITYEPAKSGQINNPPTTDWNFVDLKSSDCAYITDVGTNTDITGCDAIAHLFFISLAVCQQINKGLGLAPTPADSSNYLFGVQNSYNIAKNVISSNPAEAFACTNNGNGAFNSPNDVYMYYHALIEQ